MEILELPVDTTIHCKCGCKFKFDTIDIDHTYRYADHHEVNALSVVCPFCAERILLYEVKQ